MRVPFAAFTSSFVSLLLQRFIKLHKWPLCGTTDGSVCLKSPTVAACVPANK